METILTGRLPIVAVIVLATLALVAAGPVRAGQGRCVTAHVAEPITLPDGSEHAAGRLTLCASRNFTPVTTLHNSYVNGMPVGMWLARRGVAEGEPAQGAYMMFQRDSGGSLHLYGYASPSGGRIVTHLLAGAVGGRRGPKSGRVAEGGSGAGTASVMLAATAH